MNDILTNQNLIYHFTGHCYWKILLSKRLRFSSIYKMNDPKESNDPCICKSWISGEKTNEEASAEISNENMKAKDVRKRIYIASFSRTHESPRMWAQYANNHKGVCLIFDKSKLMPIMEKQFENEGIRSDGVIYGDGCKFLDTNTSEPRRIIDSLFRKHDDWERELEWRIVYFDKWGLGDYIDIPFGTSLYGIIRGDRFLEDEYEFFSKLTRDYIDLRVYDYQNVNGSFSLSYASSKRKEK